MSEEVWAVWFGGGSGESEEGEGEREGAERGEKIRRKEENGGKKGKNESGRKSSSSISWRRLFVYGFPVSLYDRKYGQSCRSIKRIDVSIRIFPN